MGLAIHASSPAVVLNPTGTGAASGTTTTTASFSPPAGSLLVLIAAVDVATTNTPTLAVSGGTGLTWTQVVNQNGPAGGGGRSVIWTAPNISAQSNIQITLTGTGTGSPYSLAMKLYVLTGADTTTPVATSAAQTMSVAAAATVSQSLTNGTRANGLLFGVYNDYACSSQGTPSSTDLTVDGAGTLGGTSLAISYGFGHRTAPAASTAYTATWKNNDTGTAAGTVAAVIIQPAPVVYVASHTIAETASGTSLVCNVPAGTAAGDILVASITTGDSGGAIPATFSGWTTIATNAISNLAMGSYYRVATASEPASYTFSGLNATAATRITVEMSRVVGANTSSVMNATAVTDTSVATSGITTTTANALVLYHVGVDAATATDIAVPSGVTLIQDSTGTGKRGIQAYEPRPTAGATGTRTFTETGTTGLNSLAITAAISPAPPGPKTSTLTDDFTTKDTTKWNWVGTEPSVVSGQLNITCTANYGYIKTNTTFDLTDSIFMAQIVQRTNQGNGSTETLVSLSPNVASTDGLQFDITGSNIACIRNVAGTSTTVVSIAYSATNHKWVRFRESGGTVYWESSPDTATWTQLASWTPTFSIIGLYASLSSGYWGTETSPGTAIFDNVNVIPGTPTIRARTNAASSLNVTSLSVNKPTGAAVGDVLLVTQWMTLKTTASAANMTAPAGWTQVGTTQTVTDGSFGMFGKIWKRTVDGSEGASFAFGFDSLGDGSGLDCECWQTGTFNASSFFSAGPTWGGQAASVTAMVAPSVTPTVANTMLVSKAGAYVFNNINSFTPPTGMTEDVDVLATGNYMSFTSASLALAATAATGTETFTAARASYYASVSYAVAPPSTTTSAIYMGSTNITTVYFGSAVVNAMYIGTTKVF